MSRYSRWGFFKNKTSVGTGSVVGPFTFSVSESSNTTAIVYSIDTNITNEPNLYYNITGTNISSNDFSDNQLSGNVTLDSNGNATITKTITDTNIDSSIDKTFQFNLFRSSTSDNILANSNITTIQSIEPIQYSVSGGDAPFRANISNVEYTFTRFDSTYGPTDFQFTKTGSNANAIVEFVTIGGGGAGGTQYRLWRAGAEEYRLNGAGGSGGEVKYANVAIANIDLNVTMNVTVGTGGHVEYSQPPQTTDYPDGNATTFHIAGPSSNVSLTSAGGNGATAAQTQTVPLFLQPWPDGNLVYNIAGDGGDSPNTSSGGGDGGYAANNYDYLRNNVPAQIGSAGNGIYYPDLTGAQIAFAVDTTPTADFIYVAGGGDSGDSPGLGVPGRGGNGGRVTSGPAVGPGYSADPQTAGEEGAVFVKFPYHPSYNEIIS